MHYFFGVTALRIISTGIIVTASSPTTSHPTGANGTQLNMLLIHAQAWHRNQSCIDDQSLNDNNCNKHLHKSGVLIQALKDREAVVTDIEAVKQGTPNNSTKYAESFCSSVAKN